MSFFRTLAGLFGRRRHPLEEVAEDAANKIRLTLANAGVCYRFRREGIEHVQVVEFVEPLTVRPHEIRLAVDTLRLPRGITLADLRKKEYLETLSTALRYNVRAEQRRGREAGFWYVVELEEVQSIPRLVRFGDIAIGQDAPPLAVPLGVGANRQAFVENLRAMPHLLIAGATMSGKSVLINGVLCSLLLRLSPDQLHLYLADLKGGMELSFFEGLPHVKQFVKKASDLPAMLFELQQEMERRTELMSGNARDIDGYNYQLKNDKLPYIVCVIDEIANAMLSRLPVAVGGVKGTVGNLSNELLADIAARARAEGIHLILATQRPDSDVITGLIKANIPVRAAFGTASEIDSRVIVDDGGAAGLPKGRLLLRRNMDLFQLQAPFLDDEQVRRVVAQVAGGQREAPAVESRAERERRELAALLEASEASFERKFPIRELARHTGVARDRVEQYAQLLEARQVLKRQFGPFPRVLRVPRADWETLVGPSVLRPASGEEAAPAEAGPAEEPAETVQSEAPPAPPARTRRAPPRPQPAVADQAGAPAAPAARRRRAEPEEAPAAPAAPTPRRRTTRRAAVPDDQASAEQSAKILQFPREDAA